MKEQLKKELILLDEILEYAQNSGYVDFSSYDYIVDNISEDEAEKRTNRDIQIIRDKIKLKIKLKEFL